MVGSEPAKQSIPSFPLLRTLLTLCNFPMVWHGRPPHPTKPKRAEFGQLHNYSFFVDDLGMVANFDPLHELDRWRNAILSRNIKMYSVHLSAEALLSVANHVGITIGDHLLGPDDKQKFKTIKDFWTTLKTVADTAMSHAALPEHLKLLSWDLYLLGSLVDMFVHAIFDVALDVQVALGLLVQAGIGFMAIFIESYGHALNKTWYKHVQHTVQSFLVTGHRLQDMEASSGIPQCMYMVLPGSQRRITGFGRTPTANETIDKVIPLRDVVWVGAPFAAVVNYKVNKRANQMRSTILLFAFSKAQRGDLHCVNRLEPPLCEPAWISIV